MCAKSTLQLFRGHLVLHDRAKSIFQESVQEAKRVGLLKGEAMRVALDTKPIEGRGAVEDTYNLLSTGIGLLAEALAKKAGKAKPEWLRDLGFDRYSGKSLKGSVEIDWSDQAAKDGFLRDIVSDARKILALAQGQGPAVKDAADLLSKLLLQDVEEGEDGGGATGTRIRKGTSKGRIPSATDPEVRHGRKSKSKRFTGHKASVATEVGSGIIVALDVLPGDAADSTGALGMTEQAEENTGLTVEETLGDCAYGSGATRQEFADASRSLTAKVPGSAGGDLSRRAYDGDGGRSRRRRAHVLLRRVLRRLSVAGTVHEIGHGALLVGAPSGGVAGQGAGVSGHAGGEGASAAAGDRGERARAPVAFGDRAGFVQRTGDGALPAFDGELCGQSAAQLELAERTGEPV